MSTNDWEKIEIVSNIVLNGEEYSHSELFIAHDGGKDQRFLRRYNQVQEIMDISLGEIIAEYIDEYV